MKSKSKERLLHYGINGVIAVIIAFLVAVYELDMYGFNLINWYRFLCDGFFVSSVLYIGFGLLSVIAKAGNFYAFSYLFNVMKTTFLPSKDPFAKKKTYYDYVQEKKAKDLSGNQKFHWRMMMIGLVCIAIAFVFLGLFNGAA